MRSINFPKRAGVFGAVVVVACLGGCASSSPPPARAPVAKASQAPPSRAAKAKPAIAATDREQRPQARVTSEPLNPEFETFELTIEGEGEGPLLPCNLRITNGAEGMVLDFRAERSSARRIRERARELGVYFNENRGDEAASRSPNGRPDPGTFPIREILRARPIASVEDLPDGARLTLSPDHLDRSERLRAEVLWHAGDLLPGLPFKGKTCPELPAQLQAATAPAETP